MKNLAVVGRVIETADIPNADRIIQARVYCADAGTWSGVVGKDMKVGDLVTVFLQDAVLPPSERWADMGRFVVRAPELQALNDLMSMHDELMDGHLRVGHMERAIAWARNEIVCRRATVINDLIANKPSATSARK